MLYIFIVKGYNQQKDVETSHSECRVLFLSRHADTSPPLSFFLSSFLSFLLPETTSTTKESEGKQRNKGQKMTNETHAYTFILLKLQFD